MSPTTKTSGWPGRVQSGSTLHPAGAVDLGAGLLGELPAQRAALHAGRPDLACAARCAGRCRRCRSTSMPRRVDVDDLGAELHVDAHARVSCLAARRRQLLAEGAQHRVGGVEQDDPGRARVDRCGSRRAACGARARRSARPSRRRSARRRRRRRSAAGRASPGRARARPARRRRRSGRAARARRRCSSCPGASSANWSLPK